MKLFAILCVLFALAGTAYYVMNRPETDTMRTTPIKIVAFGDSLTAGYGVPEEETYPNQLKAALSQYRIDMVNLGRNGDTTEDAKGRVTEVIEEKPDIVILGIGGNDALRVRPVAETRENIESIVETLREQANPPRIVLLQMQAFLHGGLPYKREFDAIYGDIARKYDLTLVPFIVTKIYLDTNYVLSDRIHMNGTGYAYIVETYLKEAVADEIKKLD